METAVIWERYNTELLGFIRSKVKNTYDARDLLQEVFVRIHVSRHTLKDKQKLSSWVYSIARNVISDHFRNRVPTQDVQDIPETAAPAGDTSLTKCMIPFFEKLPAKYRDAVRISDLEGGSQKGLATRNGISYSAAKSRVQRGRAMLRELFTRCCHIESDKYGNIVSHAPKGDCVCG